MFDARVFRMTFDLAASLAMGLPGSVGKSPTVSVSICCPYWEKDSKRLILGHFQ